MTSTPRDRFATLDMSAGPPELDPTAVTTVSEPIALADPPAGPAGDPAPNVDPALARHRRDIPEPTPLDRHGPARVIALCNQKGGVGKTTSAINLGAALAEFGRRVLLVDFDPQGALSVGLGVQPHQLERTAYNLLMERGVDHRRRAAQDQRRGRRPAAEQHRPVRRRGAAGQRGRARADAGPRLGAGARRLRLRADRLPAVARAADRQRADRRPRRDHPVGVRVLQPARGRAAHRHDREGARTAQPQV